MAHKHNKDGGGGLDCRSWILATILYNGFFYILLTMLLPWIVANKNPTACAVELAGFKGLQPSAAGAAATTSPAFDIIVRVSNGRTFGLNHGGGDVVVSYAGVPLARGRTPALKISSGEDAVMTVEATSAGVGVPGDLSRLMAGERRWGVAQLQIEFGFASESFVCDVQLDDHPRVFECYTPTPSLPN